MTAQRSTDDTADWWRPTYLGSPSAVESMSTIAAPLLAGFSITLIGVLSQAPEKFRLLGPALVALTLAAALFIMSVQCGFWARQYLWSPGEAQAWHPAGTEDPGHAGQAELVRAQRRAALGYQGWSRRAKTFYSHGLFALLFGLAAALVPHGGTASGSEHAPWRWTAAGIAALVLLFEIFWVYGWRWSRRLPLLRRLAALWFQPAVEKDL